MAIGDVIRRKRTEKNLSLRKLGGIIGVSGSAVAQWEGGGNITWEHRLALSNALDIPITDFLPPDAAMKEMSIKDPQEILLVDRFRKVGKKFREAYLGMLIVQGETPDEDAPQG